jgi:diguanylate cyclase (GGDEF)-like protein
MQVLLAEDDTDLRNFLRTTIERLGHVCFTAEDGLKAWGIYQAKGADVVISNWLMPGLSGLELCKLIREKSLKQESVRSDTSFFTPPNPVYTYFIFITALDDETHLQEGIEAGADDYLTKPLKMGELKFRLRVAARIMSLYQKMTGQTFELERLNANLIQEVRRDALTGLHNRLRLTEDLEAIKSELKRYGQPPYAAIMIDIDNFKQFNDTYGHQAGDEALKTTAQQLLANVRKEDTAYRYGGEEFLIILPHQSGPKALRVAEKLRQVIESLQISHPQNLPSGVLTISTGVAELTANSPWTLEEWLDAADQALYQAKQAGRNKTNLYQK